MEIRLMSLKLLNFKSIRELKIDFNSENTNIYGDNATGKTTIKDAITWLLFEKDSLGRAKFGIRTKENGVIIPKLDHEVEAELSTEHGIFTLKKILKERWSTKAGSAEPEFVGVTTEYYIDGVPKKKNEYLRKISLLIDEDVFKLITDPHHFNERMSTKERRAMLMEICGNIEDSEIINSNEDLTELTRALNGKSVDDYRAILSAQMKPIDKSLKEIPTRISEASRAKVDAVGITFDNVRLQAIKKEIDEKQEKINAIKFGAEAQKLTSERIKLENERHIILSKGPDTTGLSEKMIEAVNEKAAIEIEINKNVIEIRRKSDEAERNKSRREELAKSWAEVKAEQFEHESVCPTCGQEIPAEKIEEAKGNFNENKAKKLEGIEAEGNLLKNVCIAIENSIKTIKSNVDGLVIEKDKAEEKISGLKSKIENAKRDYEASVRVPALKKNELELKAVEEQIERLGRESDDIIHGLEEESLVLVNEAHEIETRKLILETNERQDKRINELKEEERKLASEYAELKRMYYLTDLFIRAKVNMLTERINSNFKIARFKLFNEQLNGGIAETCEVTVDGIEYQDLNSAMKVNVGLDIINTICRKFNSYAPIVIDNAESVNDVEKTESQQIKLIVTKDRPLRIEREEMN